VFPFIDTMFSNQNFSTKRNFFFGGSAAAEAAAASAFSTNGAKRAKTNSRHYILDSTKELGLHVAWLVSYSISDLKKVDLCERIGVKRTDSVEDVKKAYRLLSLRIHPDKNKNDKLAGERFALINEAYEILSDDVKKAKHYGTGTAGGFYFGSAYGSSRHQTTSFSNMYEQMFGTTMNNPTEVRKQRAKRRSEIKCKSIVLQVNCTLEQLALGATKLVSFKKENTNPLNGVVEKQEKIELCIPKGSRDGEKVTMEGKGNHYGGMKPGDIIFILKQEPHKFFVRDGDNVKARIDLKMSDALFGGTFRVMTLEGEPSKLTLQGPVFSNSTYALKKKGAYTSRNSENRGDLIVHFSLRKPVKPIQTTHENEDMIRRVLDQMYDDEDGDGDGDVNRFKNL